MPRLTRRQKNQLADIQHYVLLIGAELSKDEVVVTMKSHGTTTVEYRNDGTGQWLAPIRPSSHAYVDHALKLVEAMLRDVAPKGADA